jgi:hypothetical protein
LKRKDPKQFNVKIVFKKEVFFEGEMPLVPRVEDEIILKVLSKDVQRVATIGLVQYLERIDTIWLYARRLCYFYRDASESYIETDPHIMQRGSELNAEREFHHE